jgi:hypothetical protein
MAKRICSSCGRPRIIRTNKTDLCVYCKLHQKIYAREYARRKKKIVAQML